MTDLASQPAKTADEELADKIVDAITAANLISKDKLPNLKDGLRKGNLSSADWKLLVELGDPAERSGKAK